MIKIGFTIESYKGLEPSFLLSVVKYFGVEFVEITKTVFEEVDRVIPRMKGLKAGFHLPLIHDDGWDFSCPEYQSQINKLINNINRYHESLHIVHCISHPPEPWNSASPQNTSFELLLQNLSRLEVPVFLENVPNGPYDQYLEMYEQAKSELGDQFLGMCYDGPHYFVSGMDPLAKLAELNGKIGCVHLSDCMRDDDAHLPFDIGGEFPTDQILEQLKHMNYDGYINLEIKPRSLHDLGSVINSYLKVLKILRKGKFIRTKARLMILNPLLRRFIDMSGDNK
jgi:hypothetical protein